MMMFDAPRVRAGGYVIAAFFVGLAIGNYDVTSKSVDHVAAQYGEAKVQVKNLQQVQAKVVPALKAEADCEHWRAEVNEALALQKTEVKPQDLPADCPHPEATK